MPHASVHTYCMFVLSIRVVRNNELPAKDGNVSGRALQDALFTKNEQVNGVCLKTKK